MGKKQDDDIIKGKKAESIPDLNQVMKDLEEARDEIDKVRTEQSMLDNQLKRAVADYQNLEKRVSEGRSELTNWATTELIKKLLVVLDHYEKAISGATEGERQSGWFKGVVLATQQLQQVLKDEGLEEIAADPSTSSGQGVQFDPTLHEAVDTREPSSAQALAGKGENSILEVVEKGYNLNGKVLRPAKVIVGRKS